METTGTRCRGCPRKTQWIVSKMIQRVLVCPTRMLRIEMTGE